MKRRLVSRVIIPVAAHPGHTDTAQRVPFTSLFALSFGRSLDAQRMSGFGAGGATPLTALFGPRRLPRSPTCDLNSLTQCHYLQQGGYAAPGDAGAPPGRSSRGSNSVPSRQTASMMPASLRASATTAVGLPRRCAIHAHHSCSSLVLSVFHRSTAHAASTSSDRARTLPALLIRPRCCRSPELYSRGTSPK